jgi:hypothetical protein
MKVGYIGGSWSTNVGNAFYNLGALWLLKKVYGEENVSFVSDPPQVYWESLSNDYGLISKLEVDLLVISGPILGGNVKTIYKSIFDNAEKNGQSIAFISAGSVLYTEEEADLVSEFLNQYNISFVFTRDSETYKLYKDKLNTVVFDGLCTSMFLNDAISPIKLRSEHAVFNFSYFHDPEIVRRNGTWTVAKRKLFQPIQTSLLDYPIVRIKSSPYFPNIKFFKSTKLVYSRANMYYSDLPYGYLSILKSANYVFSDRVHTCAAGLVFGSKCMYIKGGKRSRDGRNSIFSRLGLKDIYTKPVSLDFDYIKIEKHKMEAKLLSIASL